ncbi:MAG: hypothetical protein UT55_C0013G0005 [Candidatus Peregrinibacteria bacterium GW2011_GWE2_39_6]|nr:MAG: hypothetical protein UT55_C0013G0005 [Candidatus Peregrinibacteria bacterium GW2011_GWE2_39_6]
MTHFSSLKFRSLLFPGFLVLLQTGLLLIPPPLTSQGYDPANESYGLIFGISEYIPGAIPDSGRIDFEHGDWSPLSGDYYDLPDWDDPNAYSIIAESDQLKFTQEGAIYGDRAYAWNTNAGGWINFKWGSDANFDQYGPRVDLGLKGELASTGNAYWSGYAWSETIGWIWFDWTCQDCDQTQRVHTILPQGWPDVDSTQVGDVEGYAWNDQIGWINFGSTKTDDTNVVQDLPSLKQTTSVTATMSVYPNPYDLSKYGLDGKEAAPLADGKDGYKLVLKLWNLDSTPKVFLNGDYTVSIKPIEDDNSHLYLDQIAKIGNAVIFDGVSYDPGLQGFVLPIHSFAPTSKMNGYEQNADGVLESYFDDSMENQYLLKAIEISVEDGPSEVKIINAADDPLWNLGEGGLLNFEFAPAIEVTNLGYQQDEETLTTDIPFLPYEKLSFQGLVANWSSALAGKLFEVKSSLSVDSSEGDYSFLFDSNQDNNYQVGVDLSEVNSAYSFSGSGEVDYLKAINDQLEDYVPVGGENSFSPIVGGSLGEIAGVGMIVAGAGCAQDECSGLDVTENYNLFFKPDLIVKDVFVKNSADIQIKLENQGFADVPAGTNVVIQILKNGATAYTLNSDNLSEAEKGFLKAGGSSTLKDMTISGESQGIEVIVDSTNKVTESVETNNSAKSRVGDYPDLEIKNILIKSNGDFTFDIVNTGKGAVSEDDRVNSLGMFNIYLDDMVNPEYTYSWFTIEDKDFFEPGGVSVSNPAIIPPDTLVRVCIDPYDIVEEYNEGDKNCAEKVINNTPDFTVDNLYVDEATLALIVLVSNLGPGSFSETDAAKGNLAIYVDDMENPVWDIPWTDFENKSFLKAGYTSPYIPGLVTGQHVVRACLDSVNAIPEISEVNNCKDISVDNKEVVTAYHTQISYSTLAGTVRYQSMYLPQNSLKGGLHLYNVPAEDPYKLPAVIEGSITSQNAPNTISQNSDVVAIGDVSTSEVRNSLYKRFSELTKGVIPWAGNVQSNTVTGDLKPSGNAELLMKDSLVYFIGDTRISDITGAYDPKTVVVVGGDVYLDSNIDGDYPMGLLVFKYSSSGKGGNVYLGPKVTDLYLNMYADGSLLRYDGDKSHLSNGVMTWNLEQRRSSLVGQLYIQGSVISQNTIGGTDVGILPNGKSASSGVAREYDLNDLSEFVNCWVEVDADTNTPIDQNNNNRFSESDGKPDLGDMVRCPKDYKLSTHLAAEEGISLNYSHNEPVHLKYIPPPTVLPVLGQGEGAGFSSY